VPAAEAEAAADEGARQQAEQRGAAVGGGEHGGERFSFGVCVAARWGLALDADLLAPPTHPPTSRTEHTRTGRAPAGRGRRLQVPARGGQAAADEENGADADVPGGARGRRQAKRTVEQVPSSSGGRETLQRLRRRLLQRARAARGARPLGLVEGVALRRLGGGARVGGAAGRRRRSRGPAPPHPPATGSRRASAPRAQRRRQRRLLPGRRPRVGVVGARQQHRPHVAATTAGGRTGGGAAGSQPPPPRAGSVPHSANAAPYSAAPLRARRRRAAWPRSARRPGARPAGPSTSSW